MDQAGLFMDEQRRRDLRRGSLNGIDDVELGADLHTLTVRLFKRSTDDMGPRNVRIEGGARIRGIIATEVRYEGDAGEGPGRYFVSLDKAGDYSTYTLRLVQAGEAGPTELPLAGFDPVCSSLEFRFRDAAAGLDCGAAPARDASQRNEPDINYLAKDYASFRQLMLDRLSLLVPSWRETHVPDIGVAIVEVLAYVGDYLSYQQDAVATEAYLETARRRISVRRHARLVDYAIHEGCNARTWIHLHTDADFTVMNARDMRFVSDWAPNLGPGTSVVDESALAGVDPSRYTSFEPVSPAPLRVYEAHNEISFHAWGSTSFELPAGATRATLRDGWETPPNGPATGGGAPKQAMPDKAAPPAPATPPLRDLRHLAVGDFLLLKEVRSARTGQQQDADPVLRHVVRLTRVVPGIDPVYEQPIVDVEWGEADALPFALTVSALGPAPLCAALGPAADAQQDISVACGNIVLVDQGRHVENEVLPGCVPIARTRQRCVGTDRASDVAIQAGRYRPTLKQAPLTFRSAVSKHAPAAQLLLQEPRTSVPQIRLSAIPGRTDGSGPLFSIHDQRDARALALTLHKAFSIQTDETRPVHELLGRLDAATLQQLRHLDASRPAPDALLHALRAHLPLGHLQDAQALALALHKALSQIDAAGPAHELLGRLDAATLQQLRHLDASKPVPDALLHVLQANLRRLLEHWHAQPDLLESHADDLHYTAEIDNEGYAHLRFGDGDCGKLPDAGTQFFATYRIGSGPVGNVGAETLTHLVLRSGPISGVTLSNPLPAVGGTAPESLRDIKLLAPTALRAKLERAITADDYARLAESHPKVQRAAARLRWNGSRYLVRVALDPLGSESISSDLLDEVAAHLYRYRRIGHDLEVVPAKYVALDIAMTVHVSPRYGVKHVKAALLKEFGTSMLPDGRLGEFHADRLSFGTPIKLSPLVARAQRVEGVESVVLTRFERLYLGPNQEIENGILPIGPLEIAQLDNDPNFPERGRFSLDMRGGR